MQRVIINVNVAGALEPERMSQVIDLVKTLNDSDGKVISDHTGLVVSRAGYRKRSPNTQVFYVYDVVKR